MLSFIPVIGVLYFNKNLTKENNDLKKKHDFSKGNFWELKQRIINSMEEGKTYIEHTKVIIELGKKFAKEEKDLNNLLDKERGTLHKIFNEYFSDLITWLFILGIIGILFSFIPWK
ncbi:hypothetical protein COT99_01845 [Candidatus Falkowbacteria bacterium CG10_big_fil_rev_8_21_14_0_10_43_10]|uniref:Uncharacterized protein n=1 Tax=Candidatus Falkowbacteria bacterium CG10_big_fil_rev_8_21_14_0_10_43_10 TaxID=1974567 RepID=A0A2H0V2D0_9BACT|nr:MAG: hypothetical protein COT99_01845 [Candidatus Falkowbacteria bacterium CG10_big_fil_rev_8_21_14_0_10_43_10]